MPALETIRGVPIARVGVWATSTGQWTCTREQLADAVRASRDPAFRKGVLKIGHTDPRFDGQPAVGRLENLRVDASGDVLLADLTGVPAPLAKILPSAYPSRSVEASLGVVTADGNAYALVVNGLALLGETPPAIESLGDVLSLYDQPGDVDTWVAAARVAASIDPTGAPVPATPAPATPAAGPPAGPTARGVLASAQIDTLVEEATKWAANHGITYPFVRDVLTDKVIVIGGDADDSPGETDDLFEIDWTEAGGVFTFTGPWEVQVTYVRVDDGDGSPGDTGTPTTAAAPAASSVPVRYVRGRGDVSASTPEEHPPVTDIAALVRERLGLASDASDEQVTAALEARLPAGTPPASATPPVPPVPPAAPTAAVVEPAAAPATGPVAEPAAAPATPATPDRNLVTASAQDLERLVADRVAAAVAPFREQLAETSRELADRKERERVQARDQILASAVTAGKITPADKAKWLALYDQNAQSAAAVEQVFAALAQGTAVPTATTSGAHTGGVEPSGAGFSDSEYDALFPTSDRSGAST